MNSSRKPSNPHLQRNLSSERGAFIALNQEIFAELVTFVDFAEKFTIGFVEINFPPDAEILVEALKTNPDCRDIQFVTLSFSDPNLRFLRDEIINILPTIEASTPLGFNKKLVLIVQGLEKSIGVYGEYPPVLQDLNFVRDAYKRTVPHPILFILPDYALTRLAKFAPDFWAWQSGMFRFQTPQVTKDHAINETQNTQRIIDRLEPPEKQERIELLQRLLMEYNPTGHQATGENLHNCSNILHQLGVAYLSKIEPIKAREYLEEAEKIANEFQNSTFYAEVLNTLGDSYGQERQFDRAIAYYQKSLSISQQLQNTRGEIAALFKLGSAYLNLRQFTQATIFYQQCLEIEQQIGDHYSSASIYHNLGILAQDLGEFEDAEHSYQQALAIKIEFGDRYSQASTYGQLGTLAEAEENYAEARVNLQIALEIYVEYKEEYWGAIAREALERLPE
ncbi:MAG: tetratricopeptide repeat protein [Nostoc sp.]